MKQPQLSSINIVTPSFNQGHFLKQTIESVLSEQDPDLTYWVIDGGSTDNSKNVLASFGKRINWVSEKDKGQTDAINKGIQRTLSSLRDEDIIAYINSDDYYLSGAFTTVREQFKKHPESQWLVGDALIVDTNGIEIQKIVRKYKNLLRYFPSLLWIANSYPQPSVFLKAGLAKKIGLFRDDLHYVMDYEYWLRTMSEAGKPVIVHTPLSAFRIHEGSKGVTQFKKQFKEEYEVVSSYTKNSLVLLLHRLHNHCILFVYSLIK